MSEKPNIILTKDQKIALYYDLVKQNNKLEVYCSELDFLRSFDYLMSMLSESQRAGLLEELKKREKPNSSYQESIKELGRVIEEVSA